MDSGKQPIVEETRSNLLMGFSYNGLLFGLEDG